MELEGEVLIGAPRDRVWQALNDAAVLQRCIPGCEEVVDESPTIRRARVMVRMGPVRARFNGTVSVSEAQPPQRCVMAFEGSGGAAGMASGRSQVALHEDGQGTRVAYTVKASVAGKLGQIGGRLMDASAKQLADQFFAALQTQLEPARPTPGVAAETIAPAATAEPAPVAPVVANPQLAAPPSGGLAASEAPRMLWFVLGAASTALGVWIGARLF